ncbi:MAG: tetratricopeptide repeat protein [Pseudomonadaceae bacterium]|nr:tetratricopeptide repeat protein [Pseudomonadaceae bacterium]
MMNSSRLLTSLILLGAVAGCSMFGGDDVVKSKSPAIGEIIADLPEFEAPDAPSYSPSRDEVMAAYRRVYGVVEDPVQNHAVGKRLADLEMFAGEDRDIEGVTGAYEDAISLYETLLANAAGEDLDQILYQLARANDVQGNAGATRSYLDRLIAEYPASVYAPEAHFRRAEMAFSAEDYAGAVADYGYVVGLGDDTRYWQNASYMLGWSHFKLGDLDRGVETFVSLLNEAFSRGDIDELSDGERELVEDSLRVVVLAVADLDGAASLAQTMQDYSKPAWQFQVYDRLASFYIDKERYLDSVSTWQTYVDENPLDKSAPSAFIGMIDTLIAADFPTEVKPKKEDFVHRFGVRSEFWNHHVAVVHDEYIDTLTKYLDELAKTAHADAQDTGDANDYRTAARWYEEIVLTTPDSPELAETLFLLGEVYTEAGDHPQAVAAYQLVMRDHPNFPRANEAGYAAVLGLGQMVANAEPVDAELWQRVKIDAEIEFALLFSGDERAPAVQMSAADALFGLGEFAGAMELAQNFLDEWPTADVALAQTAWLILGHGAFEQANFVAAETAYQVLRGSFSLTPDVAGDVGEKLLAAVYKQGEAADVAGSTDEAVGHFLRLATIDASAELTTQGHFDAVGILEKSERWQEAAELFEAFNARYPGHELALGKDQRLANLYERSGDTSQAAASYSRLASSGDDPVVRQQAQYRAAELYLELGAAELAIAHFRDYAHNYPDPFEQRLEAMHHLDQLYLAAGEGAKRRFWLQRKIDLHASLGSQATERVKFLAAEAAYVFAEDARAEYDAIALTAPLKSSLKRKQRSLKKAIAAFERVAEYQVASLLTASTFHIADIYTALSASIMNSERPSGLSDLETEQYDILLEEQAFPFEEQSIGVHELNLQRSWSGIYDEWTKRSFDELKRLMPGRFAKQEIQVAYVRTIQ